MNSPICWKLTRIRQSRWLKRANVEYTIRVKFGRSGRRGDDELQLRYDFGPEVPGPERIR